MNFIAIIPARYASTRFPGKPLALLGGRPVIEHVWRRVAAVVPHTVVATDDERIAAAVRAFGGEVVMTRPDHKSGTDRCWEAYIKCGTGEDVVINVQGDEPFIDASQLRGIMACFDNAKTDIATLVKPFDASRPYAELENPNTAKVVVDSAWKARYFSRSVIPFVRNLPREQWPQCHQYYIHLGMYAYRAGVLEAITRLPQSSLELAESLEQLRWLENGYTIAVATTTVATIGIDTPEDLEAAQTFLQQHS
ncbi:MAG: 3-deoxy-manno-octulosonate cytidylyltransferase [Muribaculaceae bacterium]|nr:3-deoxy-manno-octulosonate cytidylyltransferase [Muribaculaceae bacterium]